MRTVILAGGLGTRLSEETTLRPKPMVEIGGRPILWHVMSIYASHGFREFIVACGYKGEVIKQYFNEYLLHQSDWVVDLQSGKRPSRPSAGRAARRSAGSGRAGRSPDRHRYSSACH